MYPQTQAEGGSLQLSMDAFIKVRLAIAIEAGFEEFQDLAPDIEITSDSKKASNDWDGFG